jgi:class 3 adenylate cyclase
MSDNAGNVPVDRLTGFVPGLVLRRLAANPSPITEPTAERCAAAVLFADISGFTVLAEELARDRVDGAERLADLLNQTFSLLIDVIEAHGGEITKFAGDALLAIWPVGDEVARGGRAARLALQKMAEESVQCGLALQVALDRHRGGGLDRIELQIGIGAGDVYIVHLGGVFDRWEFLLSGSPLVQMTLAKEQARPGQVVLSPEVWNLVGGHCQGQPLAKGFVALESAAPAHQPEPLHLPAVTAEAAKGLLAYVPAAIQERLAAGHHEWLSELRQLTVIFVKLPSYGTSITHPYSRTLPRAQAVMQAMQSALYHYAGSINKLNVDDKGITLVAAMGLPPLSHKDDAARAVHAALEMRTALKELDRPSAIGITSGLVFCGPVGSQRRCEYTMVGNVVNMAARLMQAAEANLAAGRQPIGRIKTDILCDEATYRQIATQSSLGHLMAGKLDFEPVPEVLVKGKSEPVRAYRPVLKKESAVILQRTNLARARKAPVIGRQQEEQLLEASLAALRSGSRELPARLIIIEGEAGSGKSLLRQNLLDRAEKMRLKALSSKGDPLRMDSPYHAWQPIFRQIFDLDSFFGNVRQQRDHVLSQLPALPGERGFPALALRLSPLLNTVMPLGFPENKMTAGLSEEVRQRTIHLFLLRLLQRAVISGVGRRQPPRLLVIDNGQWLDAASWHLLASLSRQVDKLLTVVLTRPLEASVRYSVLGRIYRRLLTLPGVEHRFLAPLTAAEIEELVCQELGIEALPAEASQVLLARAAGNPLFSQELVRAWRANGRLRLEKLSCEVLGDLNDVPAPHLVHKVVSSRLDCLSPVENLALKIASTIGDAFTYQELNDRYPLELDRAHLPDALERLEALGLFCNDVSENGLHAAELNDALSAGDRMAYRFSCGFVREVAYSLLLSAQRQAVELPVLSD